MGKIIWTDRVRNEEVLRTVKDKKNVICTIDGRKVTGLVTLV